MVFLKISQNSQETTCVGFSFVIKISRKRDFCTGVSCEFCEIFTNTIYTEHTSATASANATDSFIYKNNFTW